MTSPVKFTRLLLAVLFSILFVTGWSQKPVVGEWVSQVEKEMLRQMDDGKIPGLSAVIIRNGEIVTRNYGYANLDSREKVTDKTLFEIGSCTKSFTALALERFFEQYAVNPDTPISKLIPWLWFSYNDSVTDVTIRQLLHHTSGIPWNTLSKIPETTAEDALEITVRKLVGQELRSKPGKEFQYATVNYDILALLIEIVTKQKFEKYLNDEVLSPLGLSHTSVTFPNNPADMATGYKTGFFVPREYKAPVYRGNSPAGYVISNSGDMKTWLQLQMGLLDHSLSALAKSTQKRDETVAIHEMFSYAEGWQVSFDGSGNIIHSGYNPNFTSYVGFNREKKTGVVILTNSNSQYTLYLGNRLMQQLLGREVEDEYDPGDLNDKVYSMVCFGVLFYLLCVAAFIARIVIESIWGRRKFDHHFTIVLNHLIKLLFWFTPFLLGIYLIPEAFGEFSWDSMLVWMPQSFGFLIGALLAAVALTYAAYALSLFFPEKDPYKIKIPWILLLSMLSGLANVAVVIMVSSFIDSDIPLKYTVFYFLLMTGLYILGRRFVQVNLIGFARGMVYDLRMKLIDKIFSTSYENFERIDRGRVYTALNDDVNTIGHSTHMIVTLITSVVTAIGALAYLASIAFWAAIVTIAMVVGISLLYFIVGKRTNRYYEEARDSSNTFMRLVNGIIDGFKELSLHTRQKSEYKEEVGASAGEFKDKISTADIQFTNAFLIGESFLVLLLGFVSIGMSEIFPAIEVYTIISFVIVLLYLIGPVNAILESVPSLMTLRISWNRITKFIDEIPASVDSNKQARVEKSDPVLTFEARGITYQFKNEAGVKTGFEVGPIDLQINGGEILFVIGGNGCGKTTLAKVLTGLYQPDNGHIMINGEHVSGSTLSEYFSVVFSPPCLFERIYDVDGDRVAADSRRLLKLLHLDEKVSIVNNRYDTIKLSGGQRKRLALLECWLRDSPVYLFDEWAADQDPEYRKFFYRTLLPEMKRSGKIVIAITHDDNYFDVADVILKMHHGKLEPYFAELIHEKRDTALQ
ncbi:MAG: cyclic peptide export ABC transporter [Chryseotalea sp. WA131a]|nr:MAG: cyclic peptide export ABC transporter [Chryseotalea sp. WA131a]